MLSSFLIGYIQMQLGGVLLCSRYGGKFGAAVERVNSGDDVRGGRRDPHAAGVPRVNGAGRGRGVSQRVTLPLALDLALRGRSIELFLTGDHVGTRAALIVSPLIMRTISL